MKAIDFWFDPVSPYAYLAFERLPDAFAGLSYRVAYRPIVFAALLKAYDHKGPAEIEPKRAWTFRQAHWLGHRAGIAIDTPERHPFNPIALSRLAWATAPEGATPGRFACETILRHVWRGGGDAEDPARLAALTARLAPRQDPAADAVKQRLRARDRRGAGARSLRRADARRRRPALLGLRRARHGRRGDARRSVVRRGALAAGRRRPARSEASLRALASAYRARAASGFHPRFQCRFSGAAPRKLVNIRIAIAFGDQYQDGGYFTWSQQRSPRAQTSPGR